jgi:hypothetical protein
LKNLKIKGAIPAVLGEIIKRRRLVREWEGESSATPKFLAAHFAKQNTKFGGGGSEGEAGIHFPHTPFSARLARASRILRDALPREARQSKFAVRIFVKKSSDFNQKVPLWCGTNPSVSAFL